jgi:hypothetical protein
MGADTELITIDSSDDELDIELSGLSSRAGGSSSASATSSTAATTNGNMSTDGTSKGKKRKRNLLSVQADGVVDLTDDDDGIYVGGRGKRRAGVGSGVERGEVIVIDD